MVNNPTRECIVTIILRFFSIVLVSTMPIGEVYAERIILEIDQSTLTVPVGGTFTFSGKITNNTGSDLNTKEFFLNFHSFNKDSVIPTQSLVLDVITLPNDTITQSELFDVILTPAFMQNTEYIIEMSAQDLRNNISNVVQVSVVRDDEVFKNGFE